MLYLLFFLLKTAYLVNLALEALPLSSVKHHLFVKFAAVSRAAVKGTVVVTVCKGALGGLAFLLYRHRQQPAVGRADGVPVDHPGRGLRHHLGAGGDPASSLPACCGKPFFLVVFFVVVIGLVDNILRPTAGRQRHQNAGLPDPDLPLGGMEISRHQLASSSGP